MDTPRFAKRSVASGLKEQITPVHADFIRDVPYRTYGRPAAATPSAATVPRSQPTAAETLAANRSSTSSKSGSSNWPRDFGRIRRSKSHICRRPNGAANGAGAMSMCSASATPSAARNCAPASCCSSVDGSAPRSSAHSVPDRSRTPGNPAKNSDWPGERPRSPSARLPILPQQGASERLRHPNFSSCRTVSVTLIAS